EAKEKAAAWPPFREFRETTLLAGMTPAVRTLEPGAGLARKALTAVIAPVVRIGIAERRGRDRPCGSDCRTRDSGCGVGSGADRSAMIAAVGVAIVARHGWHCHRRRHQRGQ